MPFDAPVPRRVLLICAALAAAALTGCPTSGTSKSTSGSPTKPQPLTLLVVEDPPLGQAIAREWRSRTEEELTVRDITAADLAQAARLPGDVIVFPTGLLGGLVERGLIVPIDDAALSDPEFDHRDIFDQVRLREMEWGGRPVAVPLGSPRLLLAYRADVFEKLGIEPPATWRDYQQLLERLADREALGDLAPPADQPWRPTVEPLADEWAAQLLLARAAAYAMHRDQVSTLLDSSTMQPLLDRPPYERALNDLVAAAKGAGFIDLSLTPNEAFDELRAGQAAMAIGWPAPPPAGSTGQQTLPHDEQIAFAMLPGAPQAYSFATKAWETRDQEDSPRVALMAVGGRMGAVTATTPDVRRVEGMLVWLAGRDVSNIVAPQSRETTLFRASQVGDATRWTGLPTAAARSYADMLAETMILPRASPGVRLPGRAEYLEALGDSVRRALAGEQTSKEALAQAAAEWQAITERIGVEAQRRANARSLGQQSL